MTNIYIENIALKRTVDHYSYTSYVSPEQLGLFFFFKSMGLTEKEYISFPKVSQMSSSEKDFYNKKLHQLGALFTHNETGKKRTCLFPFSIKNPVGKNSYFNGGSEFKGLLSRLTDTIDNTLVDKFLDRNENNEIKFKRGYIKYISDNFLNGQKVSLTHLSAWLCRFVEFKAGNLNDFNDEKFTRICTKYTKDLLKLNEQEIKELFDEDSSWVSLSYTQTPISGPALRSLLNYEEAPDVILSPNTLNLSAINISQDEVSKYMELNDNNPTSEEIKNLLELKKQIILYGVPGVGKSRFIAEIEKNYEKENVTKIQFHPSTTYEDFIGGTTIANGEIVTKAGLFLRKCIEAAEKTDQKFLFVIDEVNRGNVGKIFGETILALDREYEVDLIKPIKIGDDDIFKLSIPENMDIIATMNSSDRSIAVLDFAIRRRFGFVKLHPNYEVVGNMSDTSHLNINVESLFKSLNSNILNTLNDEDLLLGQAYFLPNFANYSNGKINWKISDLRYLFNYFIIPTLEEYTYGNKKDLMNIIGDKIASRIDKDDEFINALTENFPQCKV